MYFQYLEGSKELLNNHLKDVLNDSFNNLKRESRSYIAKELPVNRL